MIAHEIIALLRFPANLIRWSTDQTEVAVLITWIDWQQVRPQPLVIIQL